MHNALPREAEPAAAGCYQGGIRPGRLHDGAVGPDLRGGPALPGPKADFQGQQEHRGAQSEGADTVKPITSSVLSSLTLRTPT